MAKISADIFSKWGLYTALAKCRVKDTSDGYITCGTREIERIARKMRKVCRFQDAGECPLDEMTPCFYAEECADMTFEAWLSYLKKQRI